MHRMVRSHIRALSPLKGTAAALIAGVGLTLACTPPPSTKPSDTDKPAEGADSEVKKDDKATRSISRGTGPVARVNGVDIGRAGFDRQMDRTEARFKRAGRDISPALESRLKENLIRKLVDEELIEQKAKAEGITVSAAELEEKFSEHKNRFGNDKAFESFLKRTSQSIEDIKSDLSKNLVREKLFAKLSSTEEPTEAAAKEYFEKNQNKYTQREQVKASHILFKVAKTATPEEKAKKLKAAEDVLKQAKGGADFAELAKQHSEGPTAKRGGDLGKFSRGRMVPPFEEAAFKAKVGEIIGPVETQFGYHVIKVFEKTEERQRSYDEVKDSILTSLQARSKSRATREVLTALKKDAKIEVLEPGVNLDARGARSPMDPAGRKILPSDALKKVRNQLKSAKDGATPAPASDGQ